REKVFAQITVRRTRRDLANYPKYMEDIHDQGINFPEIAPPKAKEYELDARLSKLFYKTIFYLTDEDKISYFRYQAIRYLKDELREDFYDQAILVSKSLAAIMKTLMVKRLESSFSAFKISLTNLYTATHRMIEMFEAGKVLIAPDLRINDLMEKGFSIEELELMILEMNMDNPRNNVFSPDDFDKEFIEGLRRDAELLKELKSLWDEVDYDPKLKEFIDALNNELLNPSINPSGKLVIFTESTDTASWLSDNLEKQTNRKVLMVSSKNRNKVFTTIQENFDANYTGERKNDFDTIITTDVLAEGINLHRANVIINYDTP